MSIINNKLSFTGKVVTIVTLMTRMSIRLMMITTMTATMME